MKKKMLITLGCSFTQGDGCYDYSLLDTEFGGKSIQEFTEEDSSKFFKLNEQRFLECGWPSKLQEKLCYDELYNLGFGGASISHSIKILMDTIYYHDFSNYDVLLIQMLSFPDRISFYRNGRITSYNNENSLYTSYIKEISTGEGLFGDDDDTTLEAYFYVKMLKELCKSNKWKFLFTSARGDEEQHLNSYRDKEIIQENFIKLNSLLNLSNSQYAHCGHPNESGYDTIANRIFNYIIENVEDLKIGNATEFNKKFIRH